MKTGTYQLTVDYAPLHPDQRSSDWRKARLIKKGTLFHVRPPDQDGLPPETKIAYPMGQPSLTVSNTGKSVWKDFFALLELVPDKPSYLLDREYGKGAAIRVLDKWFEEGAVTLDDIVRALEPGKDKAR